MRGFSFAVTCHYLMAGFWVVIATGCNYDIFMKPPENSGSQTVLSAQSKVSYETVSSYSLKSCLNCHSGIQPPNLNSLSAIQTQMTKIMSEIESNSMPPRNSGYPELSTCQKAVLRKWRELGAPENSDVAASALPECSSGVGGPTSPPSILEEPVNYQTMLTRILQPRCLNCHNDQSDSDANAFLFFPYAEFTSHKTWLKPPGETSKLVRILSRADDRRMPPPEAGPPLTSDEIEFIKRFIDKGVPEN